MKLEPFCRIVGHTSEEVREILVILETVYRGLFPQLNLPMGRLDLHLADASSPRPEPLRPRHDDNLMKLVTTALEWTYEAGETDVRAERLKSAEELLVLHHGMLKIIDGAEPNAPVPQSDGAEPTSANGTERETFKEANSRTRRKLWKRRKNRCKRAHHPNARFLEW